METQIKTSAWDIYDCLVENVDRDIYVKDVCLGSSWCYVDAESGCGVSCNVKGGKATYERYDWRHKTLYELAQNIYSWNFELASIGTAALNAFYTQKCKLDTYQAHYDIPIDRERDAIRKQDAFQILINHLFQQGYNEKHKAKVSVVGHFPHLTRLKQIADITILERQPHDNDLPDSACEYVLPQSDVVCITGTAFTNKTAPRLLELAKNAYTIVVGPSCIMSPCLFNYHVDLLAGSYVCNPQDLAFLVKSGKGQLFGHALQMCTIHAPR